MLAISDEIVKGNRYEKYVLIVFIFHLILEKKSRQLVRHINRELKNYFSLLVLGDMIELLCMLIVRNCRIFKDIPS